MNELQKEVELLREKVALLQKLQELQEAEPKIVYIPIVTYPTPSIPQPWYDGTPVITCETHCNNFMPSGRTY